MKLSCPLCGSSAMETTAELGKLSTSPLWAHDAVCCNCFASFRVWLRCHINAETDIVYEARA